METPVTGQALTKHAMVFYGIERDPDESDDALRARCRAKWPPMSAPLPASPEDRARFVGQLRAIGSSTVVRCEPSESDRLLLDLVVHGKQCEYPCMKAARLYLTARNLLPVTP